MFIQLHKPEMVLITKPGFGKEIKENLAEMGLDPEFWVL
jgi:hypothetical protein